MSSGIACEVVLHTDRVEHPPIADELRELLALVGPVQPGRHQDRDVSGGNPAGDEGADHRPEKQVIGHRAGDVAHQDAGGTLVPSEVREWRRGGRRGECPLDRALRIVDGRKGVLAQHRYLARVGHAHRKLPAAVFELHDHRRLPESENPCRHPLPIRPAHPDPRSFRLRRHLHGLRFNLRLPIRNRTRNGDDRTGQDTPSRSRVGLNRRLVPQREMMRVCDGRARLTMSSMHIQQLPPSPRPFPISLRLDGEAAGIATKSHREMASYHVSGNC